MDSKKQIRKYHLQIRNEMSIEEISSLSEQICTNVAQIKTEYQRKFPQIRFYGYYPLGSEVSLVRFYQMLLEQNIPLAFPRVSGDEMEFYQIHNLNELSEGTFHVKEPIDNCIRVCWEDAVCLTPGSVFDYVGGRFGYGKGYYDRYFARHNNLVRIGICYDNQLEKKIPTEEFDLPMHVIVTEQGILRITGGFICS